MTCGKPMRGPLQHPLPNQYGSCTGSPRRARMGPAWHCWLGHLHNKLSQKLKELEKLDIIEKTTGPTHWASIVIAVPKSDEDICLCVDMRRANLDVKGERHLIPTIEEFTPRDEPK